MTNYLCLRLIVSVLMLQSTSWVVSGLTQTVTSSLDFPVSFSNIALDKKTSKITMDVNAPYFDHTWKGSEELNGQEALLAELEGETLSNSVTNDATTTESIDGTPNSDVDGLYAVENECFSYEGTSAEVRPFTTVSYVTRTSVVISHTLFVRGSECGYTANAFVTPSVRVQFHYTNLQWDPSTVGISQIAGATLSCVTIIHNKLEQNIYTLDEFGLNTTTLEAWYLANSLTTIPNAAEQYCIEPASLEEGVVKTAILAMELQDIITFALDGTGIELTYSGIFKKNIVKLFAPPVKEEHSTFFGIPVPPLVGLSDTSYVARKSGTFSKNQGTDWYNAITPLSDGKPLFVGQTATNMIWDEMAGENSFMVQPEPLDMGNGNSVVTTYVACEDSVRFQFEFLSTATKASEGSDFLTLEFSPSSDPGTRITIDGYGTAYTSFNANAMTYLRGVQDAGLFDEGFAYSSYLVNVKHRYSRNIIADTDVVSYVPIVFIEGGLSRMYGENVPWNRGTIGLHENVVAGPNANVTTFNNFYSNKNMINPGLTGFGGSVETPFCPALGTTQVVKIDDYPFPKFEKITTTTTTVERHPIVLPIIDFSPNMNGPSNTPRSASDLGSCASSRPDVDGVEGYGYDKYLREKMSVVDTYIPLGSDSDSSFADETEYFVGFPDVLRDGTLHFPFQAGSIFKGVSTWTDALGRHRLTYHMEADLLVLQGCKLPDGSDAMTIQQRFVTAEGSSNDLTVYTMYPTWIGLLPERISGIAGPMISVSRTLVVGVYGSSKGIQVIDSGRDMFADVVSITPKVGTLFGCTATQGRLEFDLEIVHAKANFEDDSEVLGIRSVDDITPIDFDTKGYTNCYGFPLGESTSGFPQLDMWSTTDGRSGGTCPSHKEASCQKDGLPWCPPEKGVCYQTLQLTTACVELKSDGTSFISDDFCPEHPTLDTKNHTAGEFHFKIETVTCGTLEDWNGWPDTDKKSCIPSPYPDILRLNVRDMLVMPRLDQLGNVSLGLEMQVFRDPAALGFDEDGLAPVTDFSGNSSYAYKLNERAVPRFTAEQYITAAVRPSSRTKKYPIALYDIWICKGPIEVLLNYARKVQNNEIHSDDFCGPVTTKLNLMSSGVASGGCGDEGVEACLEDMHTPKNVNSVIGTPDTSSKFGLCAGNIACDAFSVKADFVVGALGYTAVAESYLIETRSYVGPIQKSTAGASSRRLLQTGTVVQVGEDTSSVIIFNIVEPGTETGGDGTTTVTVDCVTTHGSGNDTTSIVTNVVTNLLTTAIDGQTQLITALAADLSFQTIQEEIDDFEHSAAVWTIVAIVMMTLSGLGFFFLAYIVYYYRLNHKERTDKKPKTVRNSVKYERVR